MILVLSFDNAEKASSEIWRFISIMARFGWRVARPTGTGPAMYGGSDVTIHFTPINGSRISALPSEPVNLLMEAADRYGAGVQSISIGR